MCFQKPSVVNNSPPWIVTIIVKAALNTRRFIFSAGTGKIGGLLKYSLTEELFVGRALVRRSLSLAKDGVINLNQSSLR